MTAREDARNAVAVVAEALGPEVDKVVVVGAAAAAFYELSPAVQGLRITEGVDVVVEVVTKSAYHEFIERLRETAGLRDLPMNEESPLCRFSLRGVLVDLMPIDEGVLGFGNQWYELAAKNAMVTNLSSDVTIRIVSPLYFIATKLEAFFCRGNGDYYASHNLEDLLTVLCGLRPLLEQIGEGGDEVHVWLRLKFGELLGDNMFLSAVPGHVSAGMLPPFDPEAFMVDLREMCRQRSSDP